jgi:DNA-binding MarR family transcriptional regulator
MPANHYPPGGSGPGPDAGTATAVDRVVEVFDGLMHRLMVTHAPELSAVDLTMSQTKALYLVLAAGHLRMTDLATGLGVTSSTATTQVDRLVELGLLARHEEPADRRQVVVTATPLAEATLEHFRELNSRRMREMLDNVAPADLAVVERALRILHQAIDAESAATPPTPPPATTAPRGDRS